MGSTVPKITIVGAGLGGPLLAAYLARRGFSIELFERRGDLRRERGEGGKSIKLTLAERGLHALREVGLADTVQKICVPLRGRAVHTSQGSVVYQPYGKNEREVIYSFSRSALSALLLDDLERYPNVKVLFHQRCCEVEKETATAIFRHESTGKISRVESDVLIGADGAFSCVRQQMHRRERADYQQEFLAWGYKELSINAPKDGSHPMDRHALHIWPCGDHMLFALPNLDGSFNAVCVLPFEGEYSFDSLHSDADLRALFEARFNDVLPLMPRLMEEFRTRRISEFVTVRTSLWHYKGKIALIGDACHSVVPFYGQGMNAAFEDCSVLNGCIGRHGGDWKSAFAEYQGLRKRSTDVLADLSIENFHELRDTARHPIVTARKHTAIFLNRLFSQASVPLYTMISHTTIPYALCVERHRRQERIARYLGLDVVVAVVALYVRLRSAYARHRAARRSSGDSRKGFLSSARALLSRPRFSHIERRPQVKE